MITAGSPGRNDVSRNVNSDTKNRTPTSRRSFWNTPSPPAALPSAVARLLRQPDRRHLDGAQRIGLRQRQPVDLGRIDVAEEVVGQREPRDVGRELLLERVVGGLAGGEVARAPSGLESGIDLRVAQVHRIV